MAKTKSRAQAPKSKTKTVVPVIGGFPCQTVKPLRGTVGKNQQPVLLADPCCREGLHIFRAGFKALKDAKVKGHFKDFNDALTANESKLMDYCVMVWGLQEDEKDAFVRDVQAKYRLA